MLDPAGCEKRNVSGQRPCFLLARFGEGPYSRSRYARIYRSLPPQGTKLGIAYSGGLDTRCAVAWLSRQGLDVYCYTADLAQPDEENAESIPPTALMHGAKSARLVDCRESMAREGVVAIQCGAFHLANGGKKYFNTTPLGRAVTTTAIIRAMMADGVQCSAMAAPTRGTIPALLPLRHPHQSPAQNLQALARSEIRRCLWGRTEMSEYIESLGLPYTMSKEKAYSTDSNVLGATHEAKDLEYLKNGMKIVQPIMGKKPWDPAAQIETEEVTVEFERGVPTVIGGKRFSTLIDMMLEANAVGGRHGLGRVTKSKTGSRRKSRGIYEAPGMGSAISLMNDLLRHSQRETLSTNTLASAAVWDGFYEGRWSIGGHDAEDGLTRWIAPGVTGSVTLGFVAATIHNLDTKGVHELWPEKLSMEKVEDAPFSTGSLGALEMLIHVTDNREFLVHQ